MMTSAEYRDLRLGDIFVNRKESGKERLPVLSVTIAGGVVRRDTLENEIRTSLEHDQHLLVHNGDIVYNMMRMWQGASGVSREDGIVSPAYVVCVPTDDIDPAYAHHLFHTPRMIYLFWAYSHGITDDRRRLYFDDFCRIPVSLPPIEEQRKITALLDAIDRESELLNKLSERLQFKKHAIKQHLMTGNDRPPKKNPKKAAKS